MLDPEIERFFKECKKKWLKKNLKSSMTVEEVKQKEQECNEEFALSNWLPSAAKKAGQRSLSTHPVTFSHPSARKNENGIASSVIAEAKYEKDGFLRSGNIKKIEPDSLGNAAALNVYDFLTLVMSDGARLFEHLQQGSPLSKKLLATSKGDEDELKKGLLSMVKTNDEVITSSKIKQVYFPVEESSYHLLSVLSHSGHIFEMKRRLKDLRFSEDVKSEDVKAKRKLKGNNQYSESGFREIYNNLTTIGYGGTNPQNISVLNKNNGGKAYLLSSLPPELSPRLTRLPTRNFFGDVLYTKLMQETFQAFHQLLKTDHNNINIRNGRDYRVQEYFDQVILKMWQVRQAFKEQPYKRSEKLPSYQKIWLFPENKQVRHDELTWLNELVQEIARYFNIFYKRAVGKSAIALGDAEHVNFVQIIERNKEDLL